MELAKKVQLMESEIDDLHRAVETLQEENQFLQNLLESGTRRAALPPKSDS
jgi:regulator of replication initiation timing